MNKIISGITGSPDQFVLEHQIFNSANFITICLSIQAVIVNLSLDFKFSSVITSIVMLVIASVIYYYSRIRKIYKPLIFPFIGIVSVHLLFKWLLNSGSQGPTVYIFFIATLILSILTRNYYRIICIIFLMLTISLLFFIDLYHPELITNIYLESASRIYNCYVYAIGTVFILFFNIQLLLNSYDYDRNLLLSQKNIIEKQRDDLQKNLNYSQRLETVLTDDLNEYKHKALQQQLNPHFIFNTLNSLQYFIIIKDRKSTSEYLVKYANLMRFVFKNTQNQTVRLIDDLDATKLYLELELLRFEQKFSYDINLDEKGEYCDFAIPPLLIQPFVERSVIASLQTGREPGKLMLNMELNNNILTVIVQDNGIGKSLESISTSSNTMRYGTDVARQRIEFINSLNADQITLIESELFNTINEKIGNKVELSIPRL